MLITGHHYWYMQNKIFVQHLYCTLEHSLKDEIIPNQPNNSAKSTG